LVSSLPLTSSLPHLKQLQEVSLLYFIYMESMLNFILTPYCLYTCQVRFITSWIFVIWFTHVFRFHVSTFIPWRYFLKFLLRNLVLF
jgi:hypothetical protein